MLLHLHVKPNSKADLISLDGFGIIRVKLRGQPLEGKANKYLVEYLSEIFNLSKSKIEIIKGQNSPHKIIEMNAEENFINSILKSYET
ncbi:MAG: DUF167 domain-containing protein [Bacteroidia bacterium]